MAEGACDEVRYTAFLSYSHKDAAAAGKLHRRLESYRLPRRLVGKETPHGIVPQRLWPIFRDRDELPAASDLSETVRTALAQSGALIILCSAHAAESLWVAEEIRVFRELHPDRPILAAILDGDPPACFPEALRALGRDGTWHEPLATDLRPSGDGAHLGLLKLVAGITGVGLDELAQRDAARRIRRVMAVTGAALAAMLIMAALAWFALDARREAERQRAETGRQIEFMLTDLRARLKSVGRLDIMAEVNRHALTYYHGQELDDLDDEDLERWARLLQAIGEDHQAAGNFRAALAALRQSHRTTAEQLARAPDDPSRIFAHAQGDFWIAEIYRAHRQWQLAERHYSAYAAAADHLIRIAPNNPDYMMEVGWGALNLGIVQLEGDRDPAAAQALFEAAVRWFNRVARVRPGDQNLLGEQANAHAWLADTFLARNQAAQSLAARRRELGLRAELHRAEPRNMARLFRLARAERAVAQVAMILGERRTAAPLFGSAYGRLQQLVRHDPRNQSWLLLKATIECDWLLGDPGRPASLSAQRLRQSIGAADAELVRQGNPNRRDIFPCLSDARSGRPTRQ